MGGQRIEQARLGWAACVLAAGSATAVAMGLMFWARMAFQIRTLPERIMEWLLLFVPLEAFEKGLQQFGPQAKELALSGGIAGMALLLLVLGVAVLRRATTGWPLLAVGLLLWLFAMAVVMPVTGAGPFARDLFQNLWLVNSSYLGVALAYATVLLLGRLLLESRVPSLKSRAGQGPRDPGLGTRDLRETSRRPFLASLAGVVASYAAVGWLARQGTASGSDLPLATIKPQDAPASTPAAPAPTVPPGVGPGTMAGASAPPPTAVPGPTRAETQAAPAALPAPPPPRDLSRDKDGSLTAAGRKPGELSPLITANDDFYIVTKNAAGDPVVTPESWRLIVDGEVNKPIQLDYRTLRQLPAIEQSKTLECISNFTAMCELTSFGCDLISTATWKGVSLKDIFHLAGGVKSSAVSLAVLSTDEFSSAIPLDIALDPDTVLAYEMNGQVMPYEHGYPARLLVPGRYGMKNAKWVMALRPMSQQFADWYGQRNWNRDGIVKTMSRIDTPAPGAELTPGPQRIAGIAYAGDRGVKMVEYSADGGASWQAASLIEPPVGRDAWVRWQGSFNVLPGGTLRLISRATDGSGALQTEAFSLPQPDGGSGRHSIEVKPNSV
jgi:DMSO/TMAO reductase YedYZ molybdopterin-dependent catalytic subunit